jgi:hypothetical protein
MDHDVIHRVIRRVALGVEGDPQIIGTEPVRPNVDQEIGAVSGGQDDVGADQRPRAEVGPLAVVDVQLQHAHVGVPVGRVGGPADHRPGRPSDQ